MIGLSGGNLSLPVPARAMRTQEFKQFFWEL